MISDDDKRKVKEATDIVDLIGSYRELRRAGRNFACLCPFHADQKPSLTVDRERQIWKCWVCDIGGDCFAWVMRLDGVGFVDALKKLADRVGVEIGLGNADQSRRRSAIYDALKWASELYRSNLNKLALDYLAERRITKDSIEQWQLGFAPDEWNFLTDRFKGDPEILLEAGLIGKSERGYYDRFKGRLIFPSWDVQGRVIAFGARQLPGIKAFGGKYVNSPETPLFIKSQYLYGLREAMDPIRKANESIVVEGYTDVIVSHQQGIKNVVACMGVAFGDWHIRRLRQIGDGIVLLLDGDEAGQKRSAALVDKLCESQVSAKIMTLPGGADPAEYFLDHAADAPKLVMQAVDPLTFKLRAICSTFKPKEDVGRAREALDQVLPLVLKLEETQRELSLRRIAAYFELKADLVRSRMYAMLRAENRKEVERAPKAAELPMVHRDQVLLELLTTYPEEVLAVVKIGDSKIDERVAGLFALYSERAAAKLPVDFDEVLDAVEDAGLKSLLVSGRYSADQERMTAYEAADAARSLAQSFASGRVVAKSLGEAFKLKTSTV